MLVGSEVIIQVSSAVDNYFMHLRLLEPIAYNHSLRNKDCA